MGGVEMFVKMLSGDNYIRIEYNMTYGPMFVDNNGLAWVAASDGIYTTSGGVLTKVCENSSELPISGIAIRPSSGAQTLYVTSSTKLMSSPIDDLTDLSDFTVEVTGMFEIVCLATDGTKLYYINNSNVLTRYTDNNTDSQTIELPNPATNMCYANNLLYVNTTNVNVCSIDPTTLDVVTIVSTVPGYVAVDSLRNIYINTPPTDPTSGVIKYIYPDYIPVLAYVENNALIVVESFAIANIYLDSEVYTTAVGYGIDPVGNVYTFDFTGYSSLTLTGAVTTTTTTTQPPTTTTTTATPIVPVSLGANPSASDVASAVSTMIAANPSANQTAVFQSVAQTILNAASGGLENTAIFAGLRSTALAGTTTPLSTASKAAIIAALPAGTVIDQSLPMVFSVPAANGTITLASSSNGKYAIDLTTTDTYPIAGYTGYSFSTPGDHTLTFTAPGLADVSITEANLPITLSLTADSITKTITVFDLDAGMTNLTDNTPVCFFGNAPVKTPYGSRRIDSLKVGDRVSTPSGTAVIQHIHCQDYAAGPSANPYVIPAGRFGATQRLLISPRHRVAVGGQMVEARNLGLEQEEATGTLTYYNLGLGGANMIVAGVTVESLAPLVRVTISRAEFDYILATKYGGRMTPEIRAACHFTADGVSVPVAQA